MTERPEADRPGTCDRAGDAAERVEPTGRVGVYVHFPWCARRCPYCDFAVAVQAKIPHEAYARLIEDEWRREAAFVEGRERTTVYFGGGTPGLWEPRCVADVLRAIVGAGPHPREVTLEVNPEHADVARWAELRAAGIDRISLGVQSFDDDVLRTLGREHDAAMARRAIEIAREAGFARVSIDLIAGAPGSSQSTVDAALRELTAVASLIDHVSAYELTWEPGTGFASRRARGRLVPLDEDEGWGQERRLRDGLESLGFARYEVSNHARPGGESLHNRGYWRGDEYIGLGVGAHGMRIVNGRVERHANVRAARHYLEGAPATVESVSAAEHLAECLMTGMRTREGVDVAALRRRFGPTRVDSPALQNAVAHWVNDALAERHEDRICPTHAGLDAADRFAEDAWNALT